MTMSMTMRQIDGVHYSSRKYCSSSEDDDAYVDSVLNNLALLAHSAKSKSPTNPPTYQECDCWESKKKKKKKKKKRSCDKDWSKSKVSYFIIFDKEMYFSCCFCNTNHIITDKNISTLVYFALLMPVIHRTKSASNELCRNVYIQTAKLIELSQVQLIWMV